MNNISPILNLSLFSFVFLSTLFLGGNAVLILFMPDSAKLPIDMRVPLALILGLSLPPIILLWTSTIGVRLLSRGVFIYLGLVFAINIFVFLQKGFYGTGNTELRKWRQNSSVQGLVGLIIIFAITWIVRFIAVEGFLVAPGSDSYHHTLIATLIAQQGQIPTSYEPYAPISSFTYHFGFHAVTAFMYWLTGIPLLKLVLWVGQGINALVVLATYFFVKQLSKKYLVALIASFLVGLIFVFPAYMVNWSRFTQLSGLVILIVTMGIIIGEYDKYFFRLLPLFVGAVFLTHYRVFAMLILLVSVIVVVDLIAVLFRLKDWRYLYRMATLGIAMLIGIIVVFPWFSKILLDSTLFDLNAHIQNTAANTDALRSYYNLDRLGSARGFYSNYWIILFGGIGFIKGLKQYPRATLVLGSWVFVLLLWSNPYWILVPGAGLVDLVSITMSLFIPISFFAALGIKQILNEANMDKITLPIKFKRIWGEQIILMGVVIFVIYQMGMIANPSEVYVRATDLQAMEWIKENTKEDAKFLISSTLFGWDDLAIATGIDAGYWIPLLTGRQTSIMPINMNVEKLATSFLDEQKLLTHVSAYPDSDAISILKDAHIDYIFVGEKGENIPIIDYLKQQDCITDVWRKNITSILKINYYMCNYNTKVPPNVKTVDR